MDLYLIRHTRPQVEAGLCYGQLDVPLAPSCATECAMVAARLPAVDAVWTSPLTRCRTLADAIGLRMGVIPRADERLRELGFGEWEGRRWETLDHTETEPWAADYWNLAPPSGERYRDLHERVRAALADIVSRPARRVAIVTHAGPIRALFAHCLELEPARYPEVGLDYGGINALRADGACWRVEYLNG